MLRAAILVAVVVGAMTFVACVAVLAAEPGPSKSDADAKILSLEQPVTLKAMPRTRVVRADEPLIEILTQVDAKVRVAHPVKKDEKGPKTLEEAAKYIDTHVSMVYPPAVCVEYKGVFYFSGGTSTKPITDFSSGFAIVKGKAALYSWNNKDDRPRPRDRDNSWREGAGESNDQAPMGK